MFSRSFLRCLMNNMTRGNTYLHSSAQRCVQRLAAFADKAKAVPGMQVLIQDTKCHAIFLGSFVKRYTVSPQLRSSTSYVACLSMYSTALSHFVPVINDLRPLGRPAGKYTCNLVTCYLVCIIKLTCVGAAVRSSCSGAVPCYLHISYWLAEHLKWLNNFITLQPDLLTRTMIRSLYIAGCSSSCSSEHWQPGI